MSHFTFGMADSDFNDGLGLGRGHGGTAISVGLKILRLHFQIVIAL